MWETIGVWVEAIALIAIFLLDWKERKENRQERQRQHEETTEQMKVAQSQAEATRKSADAATVAAEVAKKSAEAAAALQRPLVGFFSPDRQTVNPQVPTWYLTGSLQNYGTLPAIRVKGAFDCFVGTAVAAQIIEPNSGEIFPGSKHVLNLRVDLSPDKLRAAASGAAHLIFKVHVDYESLDGRKFEYKAEARLADAGTRLAVTSSETRQIS